MATAGTVTVVRDAGHLVPNYVNTVDILQIVLTVSQNKQ
jgi:hypothetical protein